MLHYRKKNHIRLFISFLIFVVSSIFITYPLLFHLGDFTTGFGDELLIAWIHSWVVHMFFTNPLALFNANIIFPYQNTLAYSDVFLTGSLLTAPIVLIIGQPIAANNSMLILSLILLGFSLYLLTFYITKNFLASLLSGLLVIFSPAVLSYAIQIQMIEVYWVPFSILFFLHFLDSGKSRYFILMLLCFLLQFYNSFLPAYFVIFSCSIIFIFTWIEERSKTTALITKKNQIGRAS